MKTTTYACLSSKTSARLFTRRILLKILPAMLLLLLLSGAGGFIALVHLTAPPAPDPVALAGSSKAHEGYYWRHSMWVADAKTYANMLVYLLRPEGTHPGTNLMVNG